MNTQLLKILILLFFSMTTIMSCGEEGDSAKVDITLIPETPLVVNSEFVIIRADGEPKTISGPWFSFRYSIANGSTSPLVVVSFDMEVTATNDGTTSKKTYTPDFGDYSSSRTRITTTAIDPGDTFDESVDWYADSLPKQENFRYRVKITFVGYFEQEDDTSTDDIDESTQPSGRFERTYTFSTR